MRNKLAVIVILALLLGVVSTATAQDRVVITWFVGLGTGTNAEQQEAQNQVVADFNASQSEIELVINVAASNDAAYDALSTLIASGQAPDIVGPVGFSGANSFPGAWLDLQPLIDSSGYDMSVFPESLVDLYRAPEGLVGIPFGVFPSFIYYSRDLFDEADLNYPPQEFGAPYVMPDGTEVEWNFDTVVEIGKILTVDANGNDATSPDFDPANIVQFGFNFDAKQMRNIWSSFGGADFYDPATGEVSLPDNWRAMSHWYHAAIWEHHIIPSTAYRESEILANGEEIASGNLAMSLTHLWYTCCMDATIGVFEWDIAVVPQYEGEYYSPTDADTFRIMNTTEHPEEAFTVLTYLLNDAVPVLTPTYGAFPGLVEFQQPFIDLYNERFPFGVNWDVAVESLNYTAAPNHEADFPNFTKGFDRMNAFQTLIESDAGADINVDEEFDLLEADLQAILDEVQ
jgi:multiple sugar transport system substrate-binding protein